MSEVNSNQPSAAEVVKLCFFVGLSHEEAAAQLNLSLSSVARAWLFREVQKDGLPDAAG